MSTVTPVSTLLRLLQLGALLVLAGCAAVPRETESYAEDDFEATPKPAPAVTVAWSPVAATVGAASDPSPVATPWTHTVFPGKKASAYSNVQMDGRNAMAVHAASSASMLRQQVRVEPADLNRLRFAWKVPALIAGADMAERDRDDSPVRIVLAFEGDRSKFSAKNALLSEPRTSS